MNFLYTMRGPDFLYLYFVWFLVTWIGMLLLRHSVSDNWLTTATGLVLFEGLGVMRYFVGRAHGMVKWDFLFIMMVAGGIFFVLRAEHWNQGSNGGWGGCGGGGCGGGGGGGCGGGGGGGCGG